VLKLQKISRGGGSLLDNKKVTFTPTPTNSITDTLRSNSNIQFSQNSRSSATGGEITPPKVSIRGSQHYENNFMINGVSNNNNLNPSGLGNNAGIYGAVGGEAQSLFLDTNLIESAEIYTEAISAEYGGFTGGVINTKLKDARMDRWHTTVNFRYTKDSWAKYHLTDKQKNTAYATGESFQPEFNKYEYTVALDGPINDNLGLMLSCGRQHSKIPLWSGYNYLKPDGNFSHKDRHIQYRDNENFLVRLNTYKLDDLEASLTLIYASYNYSAFSANTKDSNEEIKSGGLNIAYDMKNALNFGVLKTVLAYKQDELSATDKTNKAYVWAHAPSGYANWIYSGISAEEGTRGSREMTQKSFIYKSVMDFDEIQTGTLEHSIKTGIEAEFGKAGYKRDIGYYFHAPIFDPNANGTKENGVITGEQWTSRVNVLNAIDNKKDYITTALFLEDSIKFDRYTVRPGIRISTDTVTDNVDIAPRLFANVDIFDDETLNVYGGYNRYYGGLILYNAIFQHNGRRDARDSYSDAWYDTGWRMNMDYNMDGLKTPYSDEFAIGSSLNYQNTLFRLDFVKRAYKDQVKMKLNTVSVPNAYQGNYINTNDGRSDYWGVTFGVSKEYKVGLTEHFSEFSITQSKASNNLNGVNSFSIEDIYSQTHITYDRELKRYEDVPSPDYNAPLVVTYTHMAQVNDNLKLGLNARYEKGVSGYKWVADSGGLLDSDGINTRVYESKHYKDTFTVDLSANYDLKIKGSKLTFGLEVLNLLNRKNDADYSNSNSFVESYAMGRQFYANFRYEY
jgi:hypothetical protein